MSDYKEMFDAVSKGYADAAVTNRFFGLMNAKKYGLVDTAVIFEPSLLYFAFSKKTGEKFINIFDNHIANMKSTPNSIYFKSLQKWTSEDVKLTFPKWLIISISAISSMLLLAVFIAVFLRIKVKQRTAELEKLNKEMEQRIIERTKELEIAMEKAKESDRLKSAFLAVMSHELRTPLNSIIGFTGIMLQGLAGPLNEEQTKQMRMVQNSARHLLSLINDVLDISKIEAGQVELYYSNFDLKEAIKKVLDIVKPLSDKKNLTLTYDIKEGVGNIETDQRRFEQIIINILNNAIKFTEHGEVRLVADYDEKYYVISISDTGIGIKPEDMDKLFKPFQQVDTGLARKNEGTGLGLSICKRLIDMMGGEISVKSEYGRGSTFTIKIPKSKEK